jgi:hypothetical protein
MATIPRNKKFSIFSDEDLKKSCKHKKTKNDHPVNVPLSSIV